MEIDFRGEVKELERGIGILEKELGFEVSQGGIAVKVVKTESNILEVAGSAAGYFIKYNKKIHFFRGLGLLLEALRDGDEVKIIEIPQFDMNGIMPDVSQGNAVPRTDTVKKLLNKMAVMGLNMFMIYMEDSYVIKDEPYFGYMRGRYTFEELKDLDNYADALGIEVIPSIQTLAHLKDVLKWSCYGELAEDDDTLLVGEPKVYEFIERMIKAASIPFRSKRIHIGMDEAWRLGLGKYLEKNGLKSKNEIMVEHLERVIEITDKYGLKPMMWSDMFFRTDKLSGYGDNYDPDVVIPDHVIENAPKVVDMVFWEYMRDDEEFYRKVITKHRLFGKDPVFAGAVWNHMGFGVNYGITFRGTNTALDVCKKEGIREVFATIWGDDTTENNIFSTLLGMQLFAEHGYEEELGIKKLKKRFKFCTGGNFDDFMNIKYLDETPDISNDNMGMHNPSKYLLWQNTLMGLYDKNIIGLGLGRHYEELGCKMKRAVADNGEYGFLFELLEKVCSVLSIKAEIGINITEAYKNGKAGLLKEISDDILPELTRRVAGLRDFHRDLWLVTNKFFGWEIMDLRYGSLLMDIDTAGKRISDYLEGKIDRLEELEEERLYFDCKPGPASIYRYSRIPSASRMSQ